MQSLPLWERGLKSPLSEDLNLVYASLPLWERGLKCIDLEQQLMELGVAPLVGAWIEIISFVHVSLRWVSLPLWERGLKSSVCTAFTASSSGRSPCGSVD